MADRSGPIRYRYGVSITVHSPPQERSMFTTIAIIVVVLLAALLGFAATKADTFRVERATFIKAPPEKIFPLINDFHSWSSWSPYEKLDSAMKKTFSGAANGKGAVYG